MDRLYINFAMKRQYRRWRICGQMAHPDKHNAIRVRQRTLWRFRRPLSASHSRRDAILEGELTSLHFSRLTPCFSPVFPNQKALL